MVRLISWFFSDFYDSIKQRDYPLWRDLLGSEGIGYALTGRMRLDLLLSNTLRLVDTQVLDGRFFLEVMRPDRLRKLLRRSGFTDTPPIEVMARADSLEEALRRLVVHAESGDPKRFSFSALDEDERLAVMEALGDAKGSGIRSWKNLPALIRACGVDSEKVELITDGWAAWVEADKKGLVEVRTWKGGFDLDSSLGRKDLVAEKLESEIGKEILDEIWNARSDRGHVHDQILPQLRIDAGDDVAALEDLDDLEAWYHRSYWKAAADQHRCTDFESVRDGTLASFGDLTDALELHSHVRLTPSAMPRDVVELEAKMVDGLGKLDPGKFRELCADKRHDLEMWWTKRDRDAIARAMEAFTEASLDVAGSDDKTPPWVWISKGVAGAIGGGVSGILAFIIGSAATSPVGGLAAGGVAGNAGAKSTVTVANYVIDRVQGRPVRRLNERITKTALQRVRQ